MDEKNDTRESKKGEATPNKGTLQSYVQNFTKEAIDEIVSLMHNSRNEAVRMGAAKVILERSVPILKAMEIGGKDGEAIKVEVINYGGNDPIQFSADEVHVGGATVATAISSTELAQEGEEDDTSDQSTDKVG